MTRLMLIFGKFLRCVMLKRKPYIQTKPFLSAIIRRCLLECALVLLFPTKQSILATCMQPTALFVSHLSDLLCIVYTCCNVK